MSAELPVSLSIWQAREVLVTAAVLADLCKELEQQDVLYSFISW